MGNGKDETIRQSPIKDGRTEINTDRGGEKQNQPESTMSKKRKNKRDEENTLEERDKENDGIGFNAIGDLHHIYLPDPKETKRQKQQENEKEKDNELSKKSVPLWK